MKQFVCLLCTILQVPGAFAQLQPIGSWRDHLPYHQAIAIAEGANEIFAATRYSLFSIDLSDNSLHTFSKSTGLSATGVTSIAFDAATAKLIVAYSNYEIDILHGNDIKNINALRQSSITGDKTVNSIYCLNGKAYLNTGLGIVVVDENKNEVRDTYIIGQNGQQVKVNSLTSDKNFFYAATDEGLKKAALNSSNLSDYRNWQTEPSNTGLSAGPIKQVQVLVDDQPIVLKNDSLFTKQGSSWSLIYRSSLSIHSVSKSGNQIVTAESIGNIGRVVVLNNDGTISRVIQDSQQIKNPLQGLSKSGDVWIADSTTGLIKFSANVFTPYAPNSPQWVALGKTEIENGEFWATAGAVNDDWVAQNNRHGFFRLKNNAWENFNSSNLMALDSMPDLVTLAIDQKNGLVWVGSFGGGLLQMKQDRTVTVFKQNSPLQTPPGKPGIYNISGLALDNENNLWVANYGANQDVHVRKDDGTWRSFVIPYSHSENAVSQILVDDVNQKWIVSPKGNGLFCFNHGATVDNPADDRWRYFRSGKGNGNLPDNNVLSIAKDKNGFIWIGTSNGIGIIPCVQEIFTNPACEAILPIVQNGNFNGFLFQGERVQAISVDGADRKWIATRNGAWLVSTDGEQVIYHFTEDGSPLLSNDVRDISIDGVTGEVFFSTLNGICSFRSTATAGGSENKNVLVFPNPVPPGYAGQISVRGLVNNAIVKITELDGRLVFQTRALGGQAIWNGRDYKGNRVASGIYLVLVSDDNRKENLAAKIVFLH